MAAAETAVFSLLCLGAAIFIAGARTRRVWQEEPPSLRQLWWQATLCRPIVWVALLQRWMRWKLEHNPIGWLGQRTWSGRLVTWGWFAVIISLYSAVLTDRSFFRGYSAMQRTMGWLLCATVGLSAAGSFQRERETGFLELMLVSPLGESAILWGRLRGLWGQFFPAIALLLGVWLYFDSIFKDRNDIQAILFHAVSFLTLPVIGLYFSLRCHGIVAAFIWTLSIGLALPWSLALGIIAAWALYNLSGAVASAIAGMSSFYPGWLTEPYLLAACCQVGLAVFFYRRLHLRLRQRAFGLEESRA
jgi:hypothetical protein